MYERVIKTGFYCFLAAMLSLCIAGACKNRGPEKCSPLCGCTGDAQGCNCQVFAGKSGSCDCKDCGCEASQPEQVLTPLTDKEFEDLKQKIKDEIKNRKKPCCKEGAK